MAATTAMQATQIPHCRTTSLRHEAVATTAPISLTGKHDIARLPFCHAKPCPRSEQSLALLGQDHAETVVHVSNIAELQGLPLERSDQGRYQDLKDVESFGMGMGLGSACVGGLGGDWD